MTVQRVRSKDHVVRLEPFLGETPVAPAAPAENGLHAAFFAGRAVVAAAASNRTAIRFDTPDSSWVMP